MQGDAMALRNVTLEDKYTLESGHAFLTGIQALVRLPMVQHRLDQAAGLNTAGFVTGYRGSPLGALDQQMLKARKLLEGHQVRFHPGVNEDLAATSVWGTQQAHLFGGQKYDGVFGMWYGKGPGVDRSGDSLRHANLAGTMPRGGVLALLGDDHTCESSTTCHQSEFAMMDAMIPVLNPSGVQEILDFGLIGWGLSRFSGTWAALKCIHDTVESTVSADVDFHRVRLVTPEDFLPPEGGLHIRWPDTPQAQERRLHEWKLPAVLAFARANRLNRTLWEAPDARLGIVSTGKSFLDVRLALESLGLDEAQARRLGVRIYKVALSWPLEPEGVREFAQGLERILVVEEKRGLIEPQLKDALYGLSQAPLVEGKREASGEILFQSAMDLDPNRIAVAIGERILAYASDEQLSLRVRQLRELLQTHLPKEPMSRLPYFCAGCPHNTSTRVPEGSRALAGIGCHYMAQWMDRGTSGFTQMGGEGASWIGEALFSNTPHAFQNIGDGTYYHSGLLALRAAVAAGVNVTYKVLFNDAVAMTGGQPMDGPLTVPRITQQVTAEGARRVVVVSDEPEKYRQSSAQELGLAEGVTIHHRKELEALQQELREVPGVTVIVYDQTCAAEKRRRRKRGEFPDPDRRIFINESVCEGCGDCGVKSNCVAVLPRETPLGRKRMIDQSACNKDYSCANGLCPSFVSVHGAQPRKRKASGSQEAPDQFPAPALPEIQGTYNIVVTGVGGTGVVTIGALLGMAAHLEGKGIGIIDMIGLAQKGGAVLSHLRIAQSPAAVHVPRVASGTADLVLGGDLVVTGGAKALSTIRHGHTRMLVNSYEMVTGDFTRNADWLFPNLELKHNIEQVCGEGQAEFLDSTRIATHLLGDAIAGNLFLLGFAYQRGLIPLSAEALEQAIALNGVAVEMNRSAFRWGRQAAVDLGSVRRAAFSEDVPEARSSEPTLEELVAHREQELVRYQSRAYARRYRALVDCVRQAESRLSGTASPERPLTEAVARSAFKLMAYKDEYEVARLYTNGDFLRQLEEAFEGTPEIRLHLAPPLWSRRDPISGEPIKQTFGPWMLQAMKALARFKFLRGTPLDLFGRTEERQMERQLIRDYEQSIERLLSELGAENLTIAVQIASLPEQIRGFDLVKRRNVEQVRAEEARLWEQFHCVGAPVSEPQT
jgi:indolepyruvate ferredoxin oxidoreductase